MLALPGCASLRHWPAQPGVVLDAQTEEPIEGAVVVARWKGETSVFPADFRTLCYHVESAVADDEGRFVLPAYQEAEAQQMGNEWVGWTVFKAGYRNSDRNRKRDYIKEGVYYLERDERQGKERLEYLMQLSDATSCGEAGESEKNLLPLYRALYQDAKDVAVTADHKRAVETLLFGLESLEVGNIEALDRRIERRKGER